MTNNEIKLAALKHVKRDMERGTNWTKFICVLLKEDILNSPAGGNAYHLVDEIQSEVLSHLYFQGTVESYMTTIMGHWEDMEPEQRDEFTGACRTFRFNLLDKLIAKYSKLVQAEEMTA